jgi:urea carboxylase
VVLPLSWDDPQTKLAIEKYMQSVRPDAPWCPSNIEFIRRINGLESIEDVFNIVFDARYLVLGLGDVYLGAPVATPVDPRHRLVTTKYNPARTWTPENAVGIGGAYLCIYGMEGPGGYQFVGRTVPVWNRWRTTRHFAPGQPWLLRFFDQIRWFEVSAAELLDWRRDLLLDRVTLDIEETSFSLAAHHRFLDAHATEIVAAKDRQQAAFDEERQRWQAAGEFEAAERATFAAEGSDGTLGSGGVDAAEAPVPDGAVAVRAPMGASVWRVDVAEGDEVVEGESVVVLEAMKMETAVAAPASGRVREVRAAAGQVVTGGQVLVVLDPAGGS